MDKVHTSNNTDISIAIQEPLVFMTDTNNVEHQDQKNNSHTPPSSKHKKNKSKSDSSMKNKEQQGPISPTVRSTIPSKLWDLSHHHKHKHRKGHQGCTTTSKHNESTSLLPPPRVESSVSLSSQTSSSSLSPSTESSKTKLTKEIIRRLPKAELHRHLDGSVRIETIIELAKEQGVELPTFDPDELRKLVSVNNDCQSLVEYLRGFDISLSVMQKKYAITRIMYEVAEDAYLDGVKYLEVRFSPILHTKGGLSLSSIMEAVVDGRYMAELSMPIIVRIIVSGMRQMDSKVTRQLAEIAWRYKDRGVCAFDLAGPEDGFSSKLHREAFELVHRRMLNCTLHSGEASDWRSVHDSIRFCNAQRIGHGVTLKNNGELVQYVANHRIPIEICITSNIQTKAIKSFSEHPIREFFDKGLVLVPCTDNVTVSAITLTDEYMLIHEQFGFSIKEIVRLIDYGFRSAFLDLSIKKRLRSEALHTIQEILLEEGYDLTNAYSAKSAVDLAFDFNNKAEVLPPNYNLYSQEEIIKQFIQAAPKSDVNCRFNGSVSIDTLWTNYSHDEYATEFISLELELLGIEQIATKKDLENLIRCNEFNRETIDRSIYVMSLFLQTKTQIVRGCEDVIEKAALDNVKYIELQVRPSMHTKRGLNAQEVLDLIVVTTNECSKKYNIIVGLVVYCDLSYDGLDQVKELALLSIRNKKYICGFGVFGYNDEKDLPQELIPVFNILKNHQMNVVANAGFKNPLSIIPVIHDIGATRLSGCFSIHKDPSVMTYLANNGVSIEISQTDTFTALTKEVSEFLGSAVRLYLDRGIKVAPCSLDLTLYPLTRSENYFKMAKESGLKLNEVIQLMLVGFRTCYQNYWTRRDMFVDAYNRTVKIAEEMNLPFDTDSFSLFCSHHMYEEM
ncbi:hypothetical protein ABK040_012177 [Willaertia magna]